MSASQRPLNMHTAATATSSLPRRRSLPAVTLPRGREDRRASALASLLVHVLIVMLLITPFAVHHAIIEQPQGAGGPGPAGGGGGGHGGNGGAPLTERLQYMQVAPQPAPVAQVTPPTVQVPPPKPVPPPEPVKVEPQPVPPVEQKIAVAAPAATPQVAPTIGVGGGTGHDGTNGTGPGSGGGVGTGVGTGRGAGVGPGTGGGTQANYPPEPIEFFLPPLPPPNSVRGFHLVAEFDVDETGRVRDFDFTPTRDGGYNKHLQEILRSMRFRAGHTPDGTPIRMKTQIVYDF